MIVHELRLTITLSISFSDEERDDCMYLVHLTTLLSLLGKTVAMKLSIRVNV